MTSLYRSLTLNNRFEWNVTQVGKFLNHPQMPENVNIRSFWKPCTRKESRLGKEKKQTQPVKLIITAIETLKVIGDFFATVT